MSPTLENGCRTGARHGACDEFVGRPRCAHAVAGQRLPTQQVNLYSGRGARDLCHLFGRSQGRGGKPPGLLRDLLQHQSRRHWLHVSFGQRPLPLPSLPSESGAIAPVMSRRQPVGVHRSLPVCPTHRVQGLRSGMRQALSAIQCVLREF